MAADKFQALQALSNDLAAAVEHAGRAVVAVNGRPKTPSSGIHFQPGVVVMADHTLQHPDDLTITTPTGQTLAASVAGRDPGTDLAVLRVDGLPAPDVQFAGDSALAIGRLVLALGRGLSASLGVISALDGPWRTWRGGLVDRLLRADVSIYTGFSGGPLVDAAGRIIGLNTTGLSRGGGITVPLVTIERVATELLSKGHIARGYLGVGMQPIGIAETLRRALGLQNRSGLIVLSVESDGPAEAAGILPGDILTGLGDTLLEDTDDLQAALSGDRIGKPAGLRVVRGGTLIQVNVTIGERRA